MLVLRGREKKNGEKRESCTYIYIYIKGREERNEKILTVSDDTWRVWVGPGASPFGNRSPDPPTVLTRVEFWFGSTSVLCLQLTTGS